MPAELAKRRFCSRECGNAARRGVRTTTWVSATCQQCGKTFETTPAWVRNGRRKYCGKTCRWTANQGNRHRVGKAHTAEARSRMGQNPPTRERSSQWKGGSYLSKGYRYVLIETLPPETVALVRQMVRADAKYVMEHRAVAARQAGRPLTRDDVVHHVNGEKLDNRPENLVVTPRAEHTREHREFERAFRALQIEVEALRTENATLRSELRTCRSSGCRSSTASESSTPA